MAEEMVKGKETWLVAAWPGMGNVGVIATGYMVVKLQAQLTLELPVQDLFEAPHVEVSDGLARPGQLPRCMFFEWKNPNAEGKDLLLFIGEAQPASGGYSLCRRVMEHAVSKGVSRVFTFAAMASQMHPTAEARAFGVTSDPQLLATLRASHVTMLKDGQISGLNGLLLTAALEKGVGGICLMGELPFYAAGVPNPKASMAVLDVFTKMAGVEVDVAELKEQSDAVEQALVKMLEKMEAAARAQAEMQGEEGEEEDEEAVNGEAEGTEEEVRGEEPGAKGEPQKKAGIDETTERKIERMFERAKKDHSQAFGLKKELDRLGVFKKYEDRFLDLFKKAG